MPSQLGQDKFVLEKVGNEGFYVEVGASHAEHFSNSFLLDEAGWQGICVDPLINDEQYDKFGRTCKRDKRAVWTHNGTVKFTEVDFSGGVCSTISEFVDLDQPYQKERQQFGREVEIPCVTLHDLLAEHGAPSYVNYLSIDTEGSELDILKSYDWTWVFGIITVEHNCHEGRDRKYLEDITTFLRDKGYTWMREVGWDAWFVHENLQKVG